MSKSAFKLRSGNTTPFKKMGSTPQPGDSPVDFNWKAALGGAVKGGTAGSMVGPWGTVLGGLAGGISAGIKGDKEQGDGENEELITKLQEEDAKKEEVQEAIDTRKKDKYTGLA